jgi:hypothetical protein
LGSVADGGAAAVGLSQVWVSFTKCGKKFAGRWIFWDIVESHVAGHNFSYGFLLHFFLVVIWLAGGIGGMVGMRVEIEIISLTSKYREGKSFHNDVEMKKIIFYFEMQTYSIPNIRNTDQ